MTASTPLHITAIIVTHNSAAVIQKAVAALALQKQVIKQLVLVDSGSTDTAYLNAAVASLSQSDVVVTRLNVENVGFAKGNNLGIAAASTATSHFLFVNPDCFLAPDWLEKALVYSAAHPQAVISSPLYGYDIKADSPSGLWDSQGITHTRLLGRWYDIGQGKPITETQTAAVKALCGALMLVPAAAVHCLSKQPGGFFDENFYMYKEDIDTSLRLSRAGYTLTILPDLIAHHCRGWQPDRQKMARWARLRSAENNLRLLRKHPALFPYGLFYSLQYLLVRYANR